MRHVVKPAGMAVALLLLATACGGSDIEPLAAPEGEELLPDLVPLPPSTISTREEPDGLHLRFSSVLVNEGEGDFIVRGDRAGDDWVVNQEIQYSEAGGVEVPTDAKLVWGGDGHDHWHVARIATYTLVALDGDGNPVSGDLGRTDTKVGFCFYDSLPIPNGRGPEGAIWNRESCGHEDDEALRMGLSIGWGDEYISSLPGQSIRIEDLPDGEYRIWAEADVEGWFTEVTRDNNRTWVDLRIFELNQQYRAAQVIGTGPVPEGGTG
jgi:hypothetical protein